MYTFTRRGALATTASTLSNYMGCESVLTYLETSFNRPESPNFNSYRYNNIKIESSVIKCYITKCLKTSRPNVAQPCLIIPRKLGNEKLCVSTLLLEYLDRTKTKRNCNQFYFPFKPVSTQTISRWLVLVLKQSGIDISVYKGHSYRHAATSKAHSVGVNTIVFIAAQVGLLRVRCLLNFITDLCQMIQILLMLF
ncbi:hypothetical protein Ocin01_15378 [Orchesella cincta]|uniref:Tyr recombinase domain-containing protein n=1 Tax=Orchesella cincta TaxID=48709 RepID=A0A1D2MEJ2_ORCCI|nr:hypothetical protein Ocin01_15378 [Orchesella cincta]